MFLIVGDLIIFVAEGIRAHELLWPARGLEDCQSVNALDRNIDLISLKTYFIVLNIFIRECQGFSL
jgi:hypothetical protein